MTLFEWIQTVTSSLTTAGVALAFYQIVAAKRQSQSQFEDSLTKQYRRIVSRIPLQAFLGKELDASEKQGHLRAFYDYFDLCNEQVFLKMNERVREETWSNWREGITQNLKRPAFLQAWHILAPNLGGSFDDFAKEFSAELVANTD